MKCIVLSVLSFLIFYVQAGPCGDCSEDECCVKDTYYTDDDDIYRCQFRPNKTNTICEPPESMNEDGYYSNFCPCLDERLECQKDEDFKGYYFCQLK